MRSLIKSNLNDALNLLIRLGDEHCIKIFMINYNAMLA